MIFKRWFTASTKVHKPTLTLDLDGVLHSYSSGWQGPRIVSDPPVEGAIEFLMQAMHEFEVNIHSSRSAQWGGRRAMRQWLKKELINWLSKEKNEQSLLDKYYLSGFNPGMGYWDDEVDWWADSVIKAIKWPLFKPASFLTIDDRALTFTGIWPDVNELKTFKPWNRK